MEALSRLFPFSRWSRRNERAAVMTLNDLPADIIRIIGTMDTEALESMRLISRSWNAVVLSAFAPPSSAPLHRVVLRSSNVLNYTFNPPRPIADRISMWAVVYRECKLTRIQHGLGQWLKIVRNFDINVGRETIDVSSEYVREHISMDPLEISAKQTLIMNKEHNEHLKRLRSESIFLGITIVGTASICLAIDVAKERIFAGIALALVTIPTAVFLARKFPIAYGPNSEQERSCAEKAAPVARLARFFSAFSSIRTLVIDDIEDLQWMIHAMNTIGTLHVNTLELRYLGNQYFVQKMIVKLVKRHNIRHVAMQVSVLNLDNIDDFLRDVVKLNCTLDLYEIGSPMVQVCFEATRIFWEEKSEKLNQEGISMRILTCGDLMFELSDLRQRFIRTHLEVQRPMMSDNNTPTFYKHSLSSPRQ